MGCAGGVGGSPAYATLGCPFFPVPLRHCDAHLPLWRTWAGPAAPLSQVQMVIASLPPPTPPTGLTPSPTQSKDLGKSQHCLPAPSPSREEGPWLSWRPGPPAHRPSAFLQGGRQTAGVGEWKMDSYPHRDNRKKMSPSPLHTHTHTHTHTHIHTHTHLELEKEWAECEVCCDCDLLLCTALSVNRDALMCRTTCRCDWNMFQWVCLYETMFILLVCLAGLCVL